MPLIVVFRLEKVEHAGFLNYYAIAIPNVYTLILFSVVKYYVGFFP